MDCQKENNLKHCNCSYEPCAKKGRCCDCVTYHRRNRELPACFFPDQAERSFDRSYEHFVRLVTARKI